MADIDNLEIKITSSVGQATRSLNTLINKLSGLNKSLNSINSAGLNNLANSVRMLSSATSSFNSVNTEGFKNLSSALNRITKVDSSKLGDLGTATRQLTNSLSSLNTANLQGVTNLVGVVDGLKKFGGIKVGAATSNLPQLAIGFQSLNNVLQNIDLSKISELSQITSAVSKLGGKSVQNAVTQLPQLTQQLGLLFQSLSRAPTISANTLQTVQALGQLRGASTGLAGQTKNVSGFFNIFNKHSNTATKRSRSLASAIGKVYASYWMLFRVFNKLGKSVGYASALTEVQNVIDTSFRQYSEGIEKLASNSIKELGISELQTKQIAGRFQAMGTAMGIARKEMADMSVDLTRLSADIGSFYDIDTETVAEKLQSIFTGTSKPLRELGVDITEVNLKEYALKNGLDANIKSMNQAQKAMLRYRYVLDATKSSQGDFQKTSGRECAA